MWTAEQKYRAPVSDFPPAWANAWGDDRYGLWADMVVHDVTQRMRWIEPTVGNGFLMGTANTNEAKEEKPQHLVTLTKGFWLADTPCTQSLWLALMPSNPSHFKNSEDASNRPVESVSHDDVQDFLRKMKAFLPIGVVAALPTEAQWEYACHADTTTVYWWGDGFNPKFANTRVPDGEPIGETTPVNRYKPNPWGLYDMHGNVWEWVQDCYAENYSAGQPSNGSAYSSGSCSYRVHRGGSWGSVPRNLRSANRSRDTPTGRDGFLGFRVARTL